MTDIRRYNAAGRPVFLTAVCYDRRPYLQSNQAKALLLSVMREVKKYTPFSMMAYAILDDHFHWIIRPGDTDFSKIMQSVKLRFVHRLKKAKSIQGNVTLWQRRFWDHVIRDSEDFNKHMDYVHYNPVKHGYAARPMDYHWSSFDTHVGLGNYDRHWAEATVPIGQEGMDLE
jgi:putative transposase